MIKSKISLFLAAGIILLFLNVVVVYAQTPDITAISPPSVNKGTTPTFTLSGTGFLSGFTAKIINELNQSWDIGSSGLQFISANQVKVTVYIGEGTTTATQKIRITNPGGLYDEISFQAVGVNLQPDLTIAASVGNSYNSGQAGVQVPVTVSRAGGNLPNTSTYVLARLYWSTNSTWDSGDTQLWESNGSTPDFPVSYLNSNGSKTVTATVNIPSVSSSGTYYIIAYVDPPTGSYPSGFYSESNESNNITVYSVGVQLPVDITAISPPSVNKGTTPTFTLSGTGFLSGFTANYIILIPYTPKADTTETMSLQ